MRDQYNRKINYLRLSVTDRCNLRCKYCMPVDGIEKKSHQDILRHEEMLAVVKAAAGLGIEKIRLTGGEPLIRKDIIPLIDKMHHIEGIREITLTTNGQLLKGNIEALKAAGLSRINLSLDTLDPEKYKSITRGGHLNRVLECMPEIIKAGLTPLKINVVLIGGFNTDEIEDFINLTLEQPIEVRFIELMPIGEASVWTKDRFVSNALVLERVEMVPVQRESQGSPARYYKVPGSVGKVGLINPISCNFCQDCNRIRVTSDGKIKPCLHSNEELDLLHAIRNNEDIEAVLTAAIQGKPEKHHINTSDFQPIKRNMNRIGG